MGPVYWSCLLPSRTFHLTRGSLLELIPLYEFCFRHALGVLLAEVCEDSIEFGKGHRSSALHGMILPKLVQADQLLWKNGFCKHKAFGCTRPSSPSTKSKLLRFLLICEAKSRKLILSEEAMRNSSTGRTV